MPYSQFLALCLQGSHFCQVDDTEKEQGDVQNELPIRQDILVHVPRKRKTKGNVNSRNKQVNYQHVCVHRCFGKSFYFYFVM